MLCLSIFLKKKMKKVLKNMIYCETKSKHDLRLHLDGAISEIRYVYVKISYPIKYDVIFNGI